MEDPNPSLLQKAIEDKNYPRAFEAAHAIKGVSANLGLTPLYKATCALVEALRTQQLASLDAQYQAVSDELARVETLMTD